MSATADFESQCYMIGSAAFHACCQEVACRSQNVNTRLHRPTTVSAENKVRNGGLVQEESVESEKVFVGMKEACVSTPQIPEEHWCGWEQ